MNKIKRIKTVKLSISLPNAMATWLHEQAAKEMNDVSGVVRQRLLPHMRKEQAVKTPDTPPVVINQRNRAVVNHRG